MVLKYKKTTYMYINSDSDAAVDIISLLSIVTPV